MVFRQWTPASVTPDFTVPIAAYMNGFPVPGGPVEITPDRVQVLRQKVASSRPQVTLEGTPGPAVASVASCLALLHGVPPRGGLGLGLFLLYQHSPDAAWHVSAQQSLSLPERPPKPFEVLSVINPYIAMSLGVYIYSEKAPVATLRAEYSDGMILDEDTLSGRSLLVHLPVHAPNGWSREEAPLFRILDMAGNDIVPAGRIPLQRRIPPQLTQED